MGIGDCSRRLQSPIFFYASAMIKRSMMRLLLIPFLLVLIAGCDEGAKEERMGQTDGILGHWQLREVNEGVRYEVVFCPDGTIRQHFTAPDGHERVYGGSYILSGDTITIDERQSISRLVITELSDSTMVLVRTDSVAVVFDRRSP